MLDRRFLDVSLVVAGVANEPAANPTAGTQYIVGDTPAGAFSSASANQLARYDGTKWTFTTLKQGGLELFNAETNALMSFNGTAWENKITLPTVNKLPFKFYLPDYAGKPLSSGNMTGREAGAIEFSYDDRKIYVANSAGTLEDKTSEFTSKALFFWRNNDSSDYPDLWEWNGSSFEGIYSVQEGDYLFDKGERQFYTYNPRVYKFQKVNALTPSETLQIEGGDLFYNDEDKSFYFISAKGCAKFSTGGSGGAGSEFIAPVLGIVQKGEHSNPPMPVAGLKFID
ncbi:MAG: DUF2793 domain-containing protein, partial [Synergistaceae bacterium]|nr:DUF2793 domain-containing protein [Synergistaceae bacterium]